MLDPYWELLALGLFCKGLAALDPLPRPRARIPLDALALSHQEILFFSRCNWFIQRDILCNNVPFRFVNFFLFRKTHATRLTLPDIFVCFDWFSRLSLSFVIGQGDYFDPQLEAALRAYLSFFVVFMVAYSQKTIQL